MQGLRNLKYKGDVLLPKEVIEEIRLGTDLVKLVGEVVSLKRSGTNYSGRCPFHDEKTPSFSVSPSKQLYHCFGCGEGGTAITFMMKYYHLPFMDSLQRLADRLRIDLTKYQQKQSSAQVELKKKMMDVVSYASQKYHSVLATSFGKTASEYLFKKRGLNSEMISEFQIGYAPEGWDHMLNALQRDKKPLDVARQVGLLAKRQKNDGVYDVFRNRIMIPIQNPKGEWVGFGGRAMGDEQPKYLNSPQSEIFDKSRLLFGLSRAEKEIREKDFVILVEGYFDQIALYQHGFKNVVATLGTAFTEQHAELLKRYTDKIIVLFDGDRAGLAASRRSMSPLLSNGFEAKVVRIPGGQDPDAYVREKGVDAFKQLFKNAKHLADEMIDVCYHRESDLQKKAIFLEELSEIIQKTKNIYYQEVLLNDFSKKSGVDKNMLLQPKLKIGIKPPAPVALKTKDMYVEEMVMLRLFLQAHELREKILNENLLNLFQVGEFLESSRNWMNQVMADEVADVENLSAYVDLWTHDESRSVMTKVFMEPWQTSEIHNQKTFQDCLKKLNKKRKNQLLVEMSIAENNGREEEVQALTKRLQDLNKTQIAEQ